MYIYRVNPITYLAVSLIFCVFLVQWFPWSNQRLTQ